MQARDGSNTCNNSKLPRRALGWDNGGWFEQANWAPAHPLDRRETVQNINCVREY